MARITDARPGSAWDTWHKDGYKHVIENHETGDVDIDIAANAYAAERDGLRKSAVEKAFIEGARQAVKSFID